MCGFIAQLVEHRTGIHGGHRFESRCSPDYFRLLLSNCSNWRIYCDDHSSLSFTRIIVALLDYTHLSLCLTVKNNAYTASSEVHWL